MNVSDNKISEINSVLDVYERAFAGDHCFIPNREVYKLLREFRDLLEAQEEARAMRAKFSRVHPASKFNYPRNPVKIVFDDGAETDYVRCDSCGHFRSPDHSCDGCEIATLKAKLGQEADKACSAVVPDELIDAVKEIAGSHTNNEITDRPVWWIIDPRQILKPSVHEFYGTFKGPFFSREAATEYMESHRYRYGKHVKVYCGSCNDAPQFKKLYDISAEMLKGAR